MQNYFLKKAIFIAQNAIKKFYIEDDIAEVMNYFNKKNITVVTQKENEIISGFDNVEKYFKENRVFTKNFEVIEEDYNLTANSQDSCIVLAKIQLQTKNKIFYTKILMAISFYFQIIEGDLLISHFQVNFPVKSQKLNELFYCSEDKNLEISLIEIYHYNSLMINFFSETNIAIKSFFYDENLNYRYVNKKFVEILGAGESKRNPTEKNLSALIHIFPADQEFYKKFINLTFERFADVSTQEGEIKFLTSYSLIYRLKVYKKSPLKVIELGSLFKFNYKLVVNCFVLPLENISVVNEIKFADEVNFLEDEGIFISEEMKIFPKRRRISINGKEINLSQVEFEIMLILIEKLNDTVSVEEIYEKVWNNKDLNFTSKTLKAHIWKLRKKLNLSAESSVKLEFIKNKGYSLKVLPQK